MKNSYKYFENRECCYFPCHQGMQGQGFNCLFCYCPMNPYPDCLGTPSYLRRASGAVVKDCSGCTFPHEPEHYQQIMEFLKKKADKEIHQGQHVRKN